MMVQARVLPLHHLPTSFAHLEVRGALAVVGADPHNKSLNKLQSSGCLHMVLDVEHVVATKVNSKC